MPYNYLKPEFIQDFIRQALAEDIGDGDHSSLSAIPEDAQRKARLIVKSEGIIAGIEMAKLIFAQVDSNLAVELKVKDGDLVKFGEIAFVVSGKAQSILTAERLVLNCLQRMSGIATQTRQAVELTKGTNTKILDTRKTTPNFRIMEKWAVKIGGAENHRFGLFDMIMLKDNHVDYAGGIRQAIEAAVNYKNKHNKDLKIEVETRNLAEVAQVLEVGQIDVIMLDNMSCELMTEAVKMIATRFLTEASGGVTLAQIAEISACGVDFISLGALTHSAHILDMSLKAF